jgi:hypothetical protein
MPPADAISDDWQDARVLERSEKAVELEIVAYPMSTADSDIPDEREWRAHAKALAAFTKPNLTCDFDAAMTKELVAALKKDGIDPEALGDRALVEKVSAWAFRSSTTVAMGFSTYAFVAKGGRLAVAPGLEGYVETACAKEPVLEDGSPASIPKRRTVEEQLDLEVRGRSMFRKRVHGSCTSSGIYLETILRALGVPTRGTIAIPPVDHNDSEQVALLRGGLRPSAFRDAILDARGGGWTEHTFNVVFVGGRWRRINYSRLGQPIVDRDYLGLLLRIHDFDDLAASGVAPTWGRKWALGLREEPFPTGNPYRLRAVSDLLGPHARVTLPEARKEHETLTITSATWTTDYSAEGLGLKDGDPLEVSLAESVPGEPYQPYTAFAQQADLRFVLRAPGKPDVPAEYSWVTIPRAGGQRLVLATRRAALAEGAVYALVPRNETGTRRWAVADGVKVTR